MADIILMIEDDEELSEMVREYLEPMGFEVHTRTHGATGLEALEGGSFDALLLDVMLPDADGFDLCRRIRAGSDIPILMLTARGDEADRIVGLELGADDYLPKPFNPRELLARLRAILRRGGRSSADDPAQLLRFGRLEIDREARKVRVDGEERDLTSHQFELLCVLADNAGRVLSRDQLMNNVRGVPLEAFDRSIDTHISRIRGAIEDDPAIPSASSQYAAPATYSRGARTEKRGSECRASICRSTSPSWASCCSSACWPHSPSSRSHGTRASATSSARSVLFWAKPCPARSAPTKSSRGGSSSWPSASTLTSPSSMSAEEAWQRLGSRSRRQTSTIRRESWLRDHHAGSFPLPDGRWVVARHRGGDEDHGGGGLFALALLAFAIAIGAYPVVRRITRRLEALQARVDDLGKGDLRARVRVEGSDEVARLADSFNRAAERIEQLVGSQKSLLANVSHELRTPLARLRVAIELLSTEERPELRQRIERDIEELDALIGELLLASRLDAGVELERHDDVDLLALLAEEAVHTGADVSGESVSVNGDPRMLRRLVRNLLENARRHGAGSPVEASVSRHDGGGARLLVDWDWRNCDDSMKFRLSSSRCESCPARGEPARAGSEPCDGLGNEIGEA